MEPKNVTILYCAVLKETRGQSYETLSTSAQTLEDLYKEVQKKYNLPLNSDQLKVAINDEFVTWQTPLRADDTVMFIPPVSGG